MSQLAERGYKLRCPSCGQSEKFVGEGVIPYYQTITQNASGKWTYGKLIPGEVEGQYSYGIIVCCVCNAIVTTFPHYAPAQSLESIVERG